MPRLERLLVWLRLARGVLDVPEVDRLYGELNKLYELAQQELDDEDVYKRQNEYYSSIRPKRVTYSGERPIQALMSRGVQYVEVRCLDINPFLPLGIDEAQARFIDAFLLFCALADSPLLENGECSACTSNFL